jgi:hypothetical protein
LRPVYRPIAIAHVERHGGASQSFRSTVTTVGEKRAVHVLIITSRNYKISVIPAKAGTQATDLLSEEPLHSSDACLGSGLRRNDVEGAVFQSIEIASRVDIAVENRFQVNAVPSDAQTFPGQ